jgi:hypothetical protein
VPSCASSTALLLLVGQPPAHPRRPLSLSLYSTPRFQRAQRWIGACKGIPGYEESHAMLKAMGPKIAKKAKAFMAKL